MMSTSTPTFFEREAARCAMCGGKFGLVRRYAWRTPLCSTKCLDRFRARREADRRWVGWFRAMPDQEARAL